jgi:hypothetical protein
VQVGSGQIGPIEIRARHRRTDKETITQNGPAQISIAQPGVREIKPAQICAGQIEHLQAKAAFSGGIAPGQGEVV